MNKLALIISCVALLTIATPTHACLWDSQCGFDGICILPDTSNRGRGICTVREPYRTYESYPAHKPHRVETCRLNSHCGYGKSCVKVSGEIDGVCVK